MSNFRRSVSGLAFVATVALAASASGQSVENGEQVFKKCRICHQVGDNAKNAVGPILNNIIGRKAGTIEGYNYSTANKESGAVWTEETMFKYLESPMTFIPKTKMAFPGLKDEQERKDVIAYLKQFSK